jgi:pimeloyl-ACP methyl ester carboxylesterase
MTTARSLAARHVLLAGPAKAKNLAVLCGWGGSKLKNVGKYAELWHRIGWRTATVEMTMEMTFMDASRTPAEAVAAMIAEECRHHREQQASSAQIVSHSFSNGGTFMSLLIQDQAADVRFDAAVYDSCPSLYTRLLPLGAPFVLASSGKPYTEIAVDMVRHVPYAFAWTVGAITNLAALPKPLGLFHRLFTAEDNEPKPELFVYSSTDWLIPPSHVESFIEARKAAGSKPIHVLGPLANSPHCGHIRTHPEEYASAIAEFAKSLTVQ